MTSDWFQKAQAFKKLNDWAGVISVLEQARQQFPQDTNLLGELAFSYSQVNRYPDAIAIYKALCESQPEMARWFYGLGYQYYAQQQYAQAVTHFDEALKVNPDYIVVLYRKGYALSQLKKTGAALTSLEKCRTVFNALPSGETKDRERKHYADACFQQGKIFGKVGNHRLAEERLLEAVKLMPNDPNAHYNLAKVYIALERFEEAIVHLEEAQRLSSQSQHYILDYLGRAYTGMGQYKRALEIYETMPPHIQKRAYILRNMAEVYIQLERWDQAQTTLEQAVKCEYKNHNGHYWLGHVYQNQGNLRRAAQEYQKAIDLRQQQYNKPFDEASQALQSLTSHHPELEAMLEKKRSSLPVSSSGCPVGCVKIYFEEKGYGFLTIQGQKNDIFFHITEVKNRESVSVGEYFEYEMGVGRKGKPCAVNLRFIQ